MSISEAWVIRWVEGWLRKFIRWRAVRLTGVGLLHWTRRPHVWWRCHRIVQGPRSGMHRHWLVAWVGRLVPVGSAWLRGCVHNRGNRPNDLPLVAWFSTIYAQQATGSHNEGEDEDNCSKNACNNYDWIYFVWPFRAEFLRFFAYL